MRYEYISALSLYSECGIESYVALILTIIEFLCLSSFRSSGKFKF